MASLEPLTAGGETAGKPNIQVFDKAIEPADIK